MKHIKGNWGFIHKYGLFVALAVVACSWVYVFASSIPIQSDNPRPTESFRNTMTVTGARKRIHSTRQTGSTQARPIAVTTRPLTREQKDHGTEPPGAGAAGLIRIYCGQLTKGGMPYSVYMNFRKVDAGAFRFGSPNTENGRFTNEGPMVELNQTIFYIAETEVTQEQYEAVIGSNPSYWRARPDPVMPAKWRGENEETFTLKFPVDQVNYTQAFDFCDPLAGTGYMTTRVLQLPQNQTYRTWTCALPSEAQWEFAARARCKPTSNQVPFFFGTNESSLDIYAWYADNSGNKVGLDGSEDPQSTHLCVKDSRLPANHFENKNLKRQYFNLRHMYGNVWEWCYDRYRADVHSIIPAGAIDWVYLNALGLPGTQGVARGGSCHDPWRYCRSATRIGLPNNVEYIDVGFRPIISP
ncbi:MAG: formylglycine-generating enzyme family protein [Phycisphaerae bacterium]|nr:formylglycine-generating enzyme family protein [Phycisphaerae bacterium]